MIDDSALFHGTYDPQKAHEYYLRTRHLKPRPRSAPKAVAVRSPGRVATAVATGGAPNRSKTKSRHEQLLAQKKHLEARLEHLRQVLEEAVAAAKKRSGGDPNKKDKAPETQADKADRNAHEKKGKPSKPLTAKQKADKAKAAKKAYEKEHPNSLSQDVEILQEQVKDIRAKIEKALQDAHNRNKAGQHDSKSGSQTNNSGPRGR